MASKVNNQNFDSLLSYSLGTTLGTEFDYNYDSLSKFIDDADKLADNKNFKFESRYAEWKFFALSSHLQSILVFDKFQKRQISQNKNGAAQAVASVVKKHFTEISKQFWQTPSCDPKVREQTNYLVSFHQEGRAVPAATKEEIVDLFYRESRQSVLPVSKVFINANGADLSSVPTEYAVDNQQYRIVLNPPLLSKPSGKEKGEASLAPVKPFLKMLEKDESDSFFKSLFSKTELLTEDSKEDEEISDTESEDSLPDAPLVSPTSLEEIIISGLQRSIAEKTGSDAPSDSDDDSSEMSVGSNHSSPRSERY